MSGLSSLLLRQVINAAYQTKGSTLTYQELDDNLALLADCIAVLQQVPPGSDLGIAAYSSGTEYSQGDFVTFDNNIWEYINATPSTGNTPAEGAFWGLRSSGIFAHQQNTDTGTNKNDFSIGDGADSNKTVTANKAGTPKPQLRWNETLDRWEISDDGTNFRSVIDKVQSLTDAATINVDIRDGIKSILTSPGGDRTINFQNLPSGISLEGYLNIINTNGVNISFQVAGVNTNVYGFNDAKGDQAQSTSVSATGRDSFVFVWTGSELWFTYIPNFTQT